MTDEEHQMLSDLKAEHRVIMKRQEEMSACLLSVKVSTGKVEKFLYDPPYQGARGVTANDTMAKWLYDTRRKSESAVWATKIFLAFAGAVTVVGGAWLAVQNWFIK